MGSEKTRGIRVSKEDVDFMGDLTDSQNNIGKLLDDCLNLRENDGTFADTVHLLSISEKLFALSNILSSVTYYWFSYVYCRSKASDSEGNEIISMMSFEVTKSFRNVLKQCVLPSVEFLLDISKQCESDDYRLRSFQKDLYEEMKKTHSVIVKFLGNE